MNKGKNTEGMEMVRYLNSQTRQDAVVIGGLIDALEDITDRWRKQMKNPPIKVIDYILAAKRFTSRAVKELDKDLDDNEVERIRRMADTTRFTLNYEQFDLSAKAPGVFTYDITEDEKDMLVEALTEVRCQGCNGHVKDCKVRTHLFKWDVKPIYEVTDELHPCQYMPPDDVL